MVDLAEMLTELNFHGDAFAKCCSGLIDDENHWIQQFGLRSLLQALQGWTVRKMDSNSCSHTSSPRAALFPTYVYGAWSFGVGGGGGVGTEQMEEEKRKGRCNRIRRDEGKDS